MVWRLVWESVSMCSHGSCWCLSRVLLEAVSLTVFVVVVSYSSFVSL